MTLGLDDYKKFLSFASISSDENYKEQVDACCAWLKKWMEERGLEVDLWETEGPSILLAKSLNAGPEKPTLLLYGHYDVQPVEPEEEWDSPPFEPTIKGDVITARGAQDNKGQIFYTLLAVTELLKKEGTLPINVKILIEGEEEIGSPNLEKILASKKEELKADYLAVVDVGMKDRKTPAVTLGARGILTLDLKVQGTETDLHSGTHGGLAYNPIHALVQILDSARCKESGKVLIPGFYEDIRPLTEAEEAEVNLEFDHSDYEKTFKAKAAGGEKELPAAERVGLRPTFEVNGINGGYTGEGFKTVIPAIATAKISCRLVPGQDPEKVGTLVKEFLESKAPEGTTVHVDLHSGMGAAVRGRADSKIAQGFKQAYKEIFNVDPVFILEGGSIPITTELAKASGAETVLVGLGLADDQIHAPNERFNLSRFEKGFQSITKVLKIL